MHTAADTTNGLTELDDHRPLIKTSAVYIVAHILVVKGMLQCAENRD